MSGRNDLIQKIEQRVEMLQEMESEMQREKYALACDRQLLNALSIIGSLPEEVLIIIFKFHIKHTPLQVRDAFDTSIRLTHVCSRWRSIAVACPSLWNEINIFWPAWAKVFARRSLQLPPSSSLFVLCLSSTTQAILVQVLFSSYHAPPYRSAE